MKAAPIGRKTLAGTLWLAVLGMALTTAADDSKRPIEPRDILNVRWPVYIRISPEGKRVAFAIAEPSDIGDPKSTRKRMLWVGPSDHSRPPRPTALGHTDVAQPGWSPDARRLAFLSASQADGGKQQIWLLDDDDADRPSCLTHVPNGVRQFRWSPQGNEIAFTTPADKPKRAAGDPIEVGESGHARLAVVDCGNGAVNYVTGKSKHVATMDWSPDAKRLAIKTAASDNLDVAFEQIAVEIIDRSGGVVRQLDAAPFPDGGLAWSPDGRLLACHVFAEKHFASRLALIDVSSGELRFPLQDYRGTPMTAFSPMTWSADSKSLFLGAFENANCRLLRVKPEGGYERAAEPVHNFWSFSCSADGKTIAIGAEDGKSPPNVAVLEEGKDELVWLTDCNPQLARLRLGDVREVSWQNQNDGRRIYGVLVTPAGFEAGKGLPLPTVVVLHGGPQGMWWNSWLGTHLSWGQMLASHGYAVFLPNPRGSIGQGWQFAEAVYRQWGRADLQDVLDGVDYLVDQGFADPERLGVGGWSYGGFLTAAATTATDRFRAAIVGAAITDLNSFQLTTDTVMPFRRFFGAHEIHDRKVYRGHSPLEKIARCKTPTLVLHGEKDARCPLAQGRLWHRGLKSLGVETKMVVYPGAGHVLSQSAHEEDLMQRVLDWYGEKLKRPAAKRE